ncbi:MAG TPA: glycosyltransferase family 1 protein, partial [Candidatus Baltobacteraceae bacterium]|nr:glycosyltransferase family 1 protein [Candidatus Baltobacteraceae bacterium]
MNQVLRLAVDARDLPSDTRGIGRYARAILRRLVHHPQIDVTLLVNGIFPSRRRAQMSATLGADGFRLASNARGCDLLWHPANGMFFTASAPSIVTIHDAVPFRFPDADPKRREHQQAPFLRSAREGSHFIAVSNFGRDELVDVFSLPRDRIDVIYHGVDAAFSPGASLTLLPPQLRNTPYFLYIGDTRDIEPRKNFALLYQAHRRAFDGSGPPLAVVGPTDPQLDGVRYAGLANSDTTGSGDAFLRDLYNGALALCVPSYHETFGMPMVEAMACGTPVIASRASCLPEVAGDAALYAEPHDAQSWVDALRRVAQSLRLQAELRE